MHRSDFQRIVGQGLARSSETLRGGSVSARLRSGFGALLLLLAVAGFIAIVQTRRIDADVTRIVDVEEPLEQAVLEMEIQAGETVRAVLNYLIKPDPKHIERAHASEKSFEAYVAIFDQLAENESERRLGRAVHTLYADFKCNGDRLIDLVDRRNQALQVLRQDVRQIDQLVKNELKNAIDPSAPDAAPKIEALLSMEVDMEAAFAAVEAYVAQRDNTFVLERQDKIACICETAAAYKSYDQSIIERGLSSRLTQLCDQASAAGNQAIALTNQLDRNLEVFEHELETLDRYLDVDIQSIIQQETKAAAEDARASLKTATTVLVGVLVIGLFFGTGIGWWVSNRIIRSVENLVQGSEIISRGNREHRIDMTNSEDEFGKIAVSFNQMVDNLNRSSEELLEAQRQADEVRALAAQRQIDLYATEARTDTLTQLRNRRAFDDEIARHAAEVDRGQRSVMVMLVDVDHFKKFNDTHGHHAGDAVLQGVARTLEEASRASDLAARYGGEEFALILPGGSMDDAAVVADRVRQSIEQSVFHFDGIDLRVTVSGGLAELGFGEEPAAAIKRADDALYASKAAGRNCIHIHDGADCVPVLALADSTIL